MRTAPFEIQYDFVFPYFRNYFLNLHINEDLSVYSTYASRLQIFVLTRAISHVEFANGVGFPHIDVNFPY